jgi:chemotaxis protein MotB
MRKWRDEEDEEGHGNSERWLLTYSDMITLLLALFIMMYTMSNVDTAKFKALAESLNAFFNNGTSTTQTADGSASLSGGVDLKFPQVTPGASSLSAEGEDSPSPSESSPQEIAAQINALIQSNGIANSVSVHIEERGVVVRLEEGMMFPSGSATINQSAIDTMNKISEIIKNTTNYIRVEGSTDNVPIQNGQFASNWELASQRGINVANLIIQNGVDPTRISVTSYGEFRPVAPNDTEANKQMNRRVDIVFLNQNLNISEAGSNTAQQ